ncbi:MAG: taurine dioxygenase [bacterium]|nr:taurine dioxygenase [Deltaproteobacteria bacterium]MCP4904862.1 taurine dioxygenase [bacterium]
MTRRYAAFEVEKIGALGAIVTGLELKQSLASEALSELRHALVSNEVLFFRDIFLDAEEQLALARQFGEITLYPIEKFFGSVEPGHQLIVDDAENYPGVDMWHSDVSWLERPPVTALITCLEVPAYGGDTMWTSTSAAYDALSPRMRSLLDGLETVHSCHGNFVEIAERKSGIKGLGERIKQAYPELKHPLVRTHPESGKRSLFMTDRGVMNRIAGLPQAESNAILGFLEAHVDQPRFQVRWKWAPGQLAIWDGRTTLHRGVSDHFPQRRVIRRCTVDGEAPFFDPGRAPDPAYIAS